MGLFNSRELQEIERLNKKVQQLEVFITPEIRSISDINLLITAKKNELQRLTEQMQAQSLEFSKQRTEQHAQLCEMKAEFEKQKSELNDQLRVIKSEISRQRVELIQLNDEVLMQEYGLYHPLYNFATSEDYKKRLEHIRLKQKGMVRESTAASCTTKWTVNGSESQGQTMITNNIKQIVRSFNAECENAIDRVEFNNIDSMNKRIKRSYDHLNKLNKTNAICISEKYYNLKIEELHLAIEYALKKQQEKEELKRIREEQREEAKLAKELEEARKEIGKEQKHYNNLLSKLDTQLLATADEVKRSELIEKRGDVVAQIADLDKALQDVDYRAANMKAGYVYIISNIGSFGENIYKIGMTRRLDPMERIDELGDASVPFNFDTHAIIFSEDAPALEAALHRAFDSKKLNMVNTRREFFRVTLSDIEEVVRKNYDKIVDFNVIPPAEQYRNSERIRDELCK